MRPACKRMLHAFENDARFAASGHAAKQRRPRLVRIQQREQDIQRIFLLLGKRLSAGIRTRTSIRQAGDTAVFNRDQSFTGRARDNLGGHAVILRTTRSASATVFQPAVPTSSQTFLRTGAARAVEIFSQRGIIDRGIDQTPDGLFVLSAHDAHTLFRKSRSNKCMQRTCGFIPKARQTSSRRVSSRSRIAQEGVHLAGKPLRPRLRQAARHRSLPSRQTARAAALRAARCRSCRRCAI